MTNVIKGDLKKFSSIQLDLIRDVLQKLEFNRVDVEIAPLGTPGESMASDVRKIKINVTNQKTFHIIVKLTPYTDKRENSLSNASHVIFNNEITIYNEVLKIMSEIETNTGENDLFKYATCYGAIREKTNEIVLLEDLSTENYIMLDKFEPLSNETIKLVLSSLANFHSLSYILKKKWPKIYSEFSDKLIDMHTLEENKKNANAYAALGEDFSDIFDDIKYQSIVKQLFKDHFNEALKLYEADKNSEYSVIVHGDCWTNNILFQLKDGVPNKCVLIDYQLSRESLPAGDILYLILNCTDYKTRFEHFSNWADFYYTELEKNLLRFDLNINSVYPRDHFDADLKKYSKFNLGFAILVCSIILRERSEATEMKEMISTVDDVGDYYSSIKVTNLNKDTISKIKDRVEGLIDSCIELGYVNGN